MPHAALRFSRHAVVVLAATPVFFSAALAQGPSSGETLMKEPAIRAALDAVQANEPELLNEQVRLCEIPAPPFAEQARGLAYKAAFERLGLKNVRVDAVGNVLGERPGRQPRPHLVMSAHLDTVFPEGTVVKTTRTGTVDRRSGHRRRLPRPGGRARRDSGDERGQGRDRRNDHVRRHGGGGGARRSPRRQAPVQDRAGRPDRQLCVGRRRGHLDHPNRGWQPPLPRNVQGPRRAQLRRFRDRQPGPRARPGDRDDCARSRCHASQKPRSTSAGSAAGRRSTRLPPRRGWKSTCDRRTARR